MATPTQIRKTIDDKLVTLWGAIQTKENAYAASHGGRYWQGLITHSVLPVDGATTPPNVGTKTPTDQPDPYPSALLTSALPMAIQIDTYDGPNGTGYQATVYVKLNGKTWARTAQVGNETWRASAWQQIDISGV